MKDYIISAVIVSYNDYDALNNCINSIDEQVNNIIVVDNSTNGKEFFSDKKVTHINNQTNIGLAKALNMGINKALDIGSDWVLLLDQDSVVDKGMIKNMLISYDESNDKKSIAEIVPTIYDNNLNKYIPSLLYNKFSIKKIFTPDEDSFVDFQITSGSLIKRDVLENIGLMDDTLFIDYIDFDFCFRVKKQGYKILLSSKALLNHSLGEKNKMFFLEFREHNPIRVYYQMRNRMIIIKRFRKEFPFFMLNEFRRMILKLFKIILLESNKKMKLVNYFKGFGDSFR